MTALFHRTLQLRHQLSTTRSEPRDEEPCACACDTIRKQLQWSAASAVGRCRWGGLEHLDCPVVLVLMMVLRLAAVVEVVAASLKNTGFAVQGRKIGRDGATLRVSVPSVTTTDEE